MTMTGVRRGCGVREPGGIYIGARHDPNGLPIWDFLIDPPMPVPPELGLPDRGVLLVQDADGVTHVFDRVGLSGYPNVADFIEETMRYGLSRRIQRSADFAALDARSTIILAHPRAIITNADAYYTELYVESEDYQNAHPWACVCETRREGSKRPERINGFRHSDFVAGWDELPTPNPTCASLWWEDIRDGDVLADPDAAPRTTVRECGSTRYSGRHAPLALDGEYAEGFFLSFRIGNLTVIDDPDSDDAVAAVERASAADLDVIVEDA